jgi:hypothetical protein
MARVDVVHPSPHGVWSRAFERGAKEWQEGSRARESLKVSVAQLQMMGEKLRQDSIRDDNQFRLESAKIDRDTTKDMRDAHLARIQLTDARNAQEDERVASEERNDLLAQQIRSRAKSEKQKLWQDKLFEYKDDPELRLATYREGVYDKDILADPQGLADLGIRNKRITEATNFYIGEYKDSLNESAHERNQVSTEMNNIYLADMNLADRKNLGWYDDYKKNQDDLRQTLSGVESVNRLLDAPTGLLEKYVSAEDREKYKAMFNNVRDAVGFNMAFQNMTENIASNQKDYDTQLASLNAIKKAVYTGLATAAKDPMSGVSMQEMINSVDRQINFLQSGAGFQKSQTSDQPVLKDPPPTPAGPVAAGVGGNVFFQRLGSDKVEKLSSDEANKLAAEGKGQIRGTVGDKMSAEDITMNKDIYDADGNRFKVVSKTAAYSAPTGAMAQQLGAGRFGRQRAPAKVTLARFKDGKYVDREEHKLSDVINNFSASKITKPAALPSVSGGDIPPEEYLKRGYSPSEAYNALLNRLEERLGREATQTEVDSLYTQALPSYGYGTK